MVFNAASVILSGSATIAGTFIKHFVDREPQKKTPLRKDLVYDEAFSVLKDFFNQTTLNTVEDLQAFGNNFVPAPPHVRVIRVAIPVATRLEAGEALIQALGEEQVRDIVGGREWWQRTAQKHGGVSAEWIAMKRDWKEFDGKRPMKDGETEEDLENRRIEDLRKLKERARATRRRAKKHAKQQARDNSSQAKVNGEDGFETETTDGEHSSNEDGLPSSDQYSADMDDMRCCYYIHGGGHFFGSINTHRYVIWRLARKIGGRAFDLNYRLSPQYPFPCALSDVLAGYLYLIRPPPGAKHKAVDPAKLVIAGDSAGGNLALALMCLLRDSGLPLPAGGVLISPWLDMTHSFPSILENTETDIPPSWGWMFKPSTLWPPPPRDFQERADRSTSLSELKEYEERREAKKKEKHHLFGGKKRSGTSREAKERREATDRKKSDLASEVGGKEHDPHDGDPQKAEGTSKDQNATAEPARVVKVLVDGEEVEIVDQIQLYSTNEQLTHPLVSPVWQQSLGGLPPLYIMCGDKEVLRDEIVYAAHRAAHPREYPVRDGLLLSDPEQRKKADDYPPTQVHLQIYDDVCHDLPLMSFTTPAKYCYRAMASFIKFVTANPDDSPPSPVSPLSVPPSGHATPSGPADMSRSASAQSLGEGAASHSKPTDSTRLSVPSTPRSSAMQSRTLSASRLLDFLTPSPKSPKYPKRSDRLDETIYSSTRPSHRPDYVDNMIRERIAIDGTVREMEKREEMSMLNLDRDKIGLIVEAPVKRYLAGKAILDKRFKKVCDHVQKRREHHLKQSIKEEAARIRKRHTEQNARQSRETSPLNPQSDRPARTESPERLEAVEGIWALHGERPPPSSIAARKDTMEARRLAHFLDQHYNKIHALRLWEQVQDVGEAVRGRDREKVSPPTDSQEQVMLESPSHPDKTNVKSL